MENVAVEVEKEFIELGRMYLATEKGGGSLELITWKGEPAVIINGKYIVRHSVLNQHLANNEARRRAEKEDGQQ